MRSKLLVITLLSFLLGLGGQVALAQVPIATPVPLELEGPISSVVDNGNGTGTITVMGITVEIPATAVIHTPTNPALTLAQLADPTPLPGRTAPGFIGGTAIIIGQTNGVRIVAQDIFTEPAENVVLGVITEAICTNVDCSGPNDSLQILGAPVSRLTDPRMPANPPKNAFGFLIDMSQGNLVGAPASIEGYFGQVAVAPETVPALHYFILEVEGGTLLNPGVPEVSILRAQCRERGDRGIELEVRGAVHGPATATVQFFNTASPATVFGTIVPVPDAADPVFGSYRFQLQDNPAFLTCPASITARMVDFPAAQPAVSEVDIIDAPVAPLPPLPPPPPPPTNTAPSFTSAPVLTATVGTAYSYDANATDSAGNTLTFTLISGPAGMTANETSGIVSWTPTAAQLGANAVSLRVTDQGGLSATQNFTITVSTGTPPPTNTAPSFTSTPVLTATVNVAYSYDANATDSAGDTLTFTLVSGPTGMTVNQTSGIVSWTPTSLQSGANPVSIQVTDQGGLSATQNFTVNVGPIQTEVLIITDAEYDISVGRILIRGTTTLNGSFLTATLTRTGDFIASRDAGLAGYWSMRAELTPDKAPRPGDTVTVRSNNGASAVATIRVVP